MPAILLEAPFVPILGFGLTSPVFGHSTSPMVPSLNPSSPDTSTLIHWSSLSWLSNVQLDSLTPAEQQAHSRQVPQFCLLTSAEAWAMRVTTSSPQGQGLISMFAESLRLLDVAVNCQHIAGVDNAVAGDISRSTNPHDPLLLRSQQLIQKCPLMRTHLCFQPHQSCCSSHTPGCSLHVRWSVVLPSLPKPLGRFIPTESIAFDGQN